MRYGTGNRETGVSGGHAALVYDFKGNVVERDPIAAGLPTMDYVWDMRDRLKLAIDDNDAIHSASYDYDALGRLLGRVETDLTTDTFFTTYHYWLGLNRLAEERYPCEVRMKKCE